MYKLQILDPPLASRSRNKVLLTGLDETGSFCLNSIFILENLLNLCKYLVANPVSKMHYGFNKLISSWEKVVKEYSVNLINNQGAIM